MCWVDGRLAPISAASVPVLSNAIFRGTTVFDVISIVPTRRGPAAVGLREHLERFMNSMLSMYMTPSVSVEDLAEAIREVVAANPGCGIVRTVACWDGAPALVPADRTPRVVVTAEPSGPAARPSIALQSAVAKIDPVVMPTQIKVAAMYAAGIRAQIAAQNDGFDAIVSRSGEGLLTEGVSSSVVLVADGRLVAPPLAEVLDSITRALVLDAASGVSIQAEIRSVPWDEVRLAQAAFMSSTTAPILPIRRIDDTIYQVDHPIVAALQDVVASVLADDHHLSQRWLSPLA